ncbi:MAG: hypothetical protein RXN92_06510 [Thermoplasmatales archaeon]
MICYVVRKEKFNDIKSRLIQENIEFLEDEAKFHVLIIPLSQKEIENIGKKYLLMEEKEVGELDFPGQSFRIESSKDVIDKFAGLFISKGKRVDLENPENIIEIKKWKGKYLVSVS